jgi:hypothetical protein
VVREAGVADGELLDVDEQIHAVHLPAALPPSSPGPSRGRPCPACSWGGLCSP